MRIVVIRGVILAGECQFPIRLIYIIRQTFLNHYFFSANLSFMDSTRRPSLSDLMRNFTLPLYP
ncbi:hypothetical protein L4C36_14565 [Photobacterium japonica]|uniref:hypothetical protein n=1 Tax=Photobacterium japonica TaxID=2910235 RepID=UPI003D0C4E8D